MFFHFSILLIAIGLPDFFKQKTIPLGQVIPIEILNVSDVTSTAGGTASNLAGTISTAGAISLTAGGANTEAVGQVVSTLIVQ